MDVAHGHKILLVFVFDHCGQKIVDTTRGTEKHLALAILHVFLDIERNGFCHTEILHVLRNVCTQLLGKREIVVNGMTRREDYCRIVQNVYPLGTELLC